ncbi:DUF4253 domain-containing protein [Mesobacillus jeotgali]|uniref:DUF4253 domain-containing protein n=1 Tax=Mesobacillus jeotgali TaxID=129985 RepID=UPI0015903F50|nr:DUF4253 domain-containing protein [Mesobacillus jeotgali]
MEANYQAIPEGQEFKAFAKEIFGFCPDIVEQGTGSLKDLIQEMKETRKLFLWWD